MSENLKRSASKLRYPGLRGHAKPRGAGAPTNCGGVAIAATMTDGGRPRAVAPQPLSDILGYSLAGQLKLSMAQVSDAFDRVARSCFLLALAQYRSAGNGARVASTALVAAALNNGGLTTPADPPDQYQGGPAFKTAEIPILVANAILAGLVPPPAADGNVAYCVILPENTVNLDTKGGFWGQHNNSSVAYIEANGQNQSLELTWLWVTHAGVLSELTGIFGHELAETCSDPGWKGQWAFGVTNWGPPGATSGTGSESATSAKASAARSTISTFSRIFRTPIKPASCPRLIGRPIRGRPALQVWE